MCPPEDRRARLAAIEFVLSHGGPMIARTPPRTGQMLGSTAPRARFRAECDRAVSVGGALALDGGCRVKGSEKLGHLTGGRRVVINRSDEVLVPLLGHRWPP